MEQMRNTADLADRAVNSLACFSSQLSIAVYRRMPLHRVQHNFCGGKFLPNPVMKFPREATALFVLGCHKVSGKSS